jgi:hypothetical protein
MADTGRQFDFDERETQEAPSSLIQTPGFTPGAEMNPSKIMDGASPTRGAADFLPGNAGMTEGFAFGPYGPDLDSVWVRHQKIFGVIDSTRGIITSRGLQDLLEQSVSKSDMRNGIITCLNKSGGLIDSIRIADFASLGASTAMTESVRKIFETITEKLPFKCIEVFSEVFVEIFDMIAPKICGHFSLVPHTSETSHLFPPKHFT